MSWTIISPDLTRTTRQAGGIGRTNHKDNTGVEVYDIFSVVESPAQKDLIWAAPTTGWCTSPTMRTALGERHAQSDA